MGCVPGPLPPRPREPENVIMGSNPPRPAITFRVFLALLVTHGGRLTLRRRVRRWIWSWRRTVNKTPAQMEAKYSGLMYTPTRGQAVTL